MNNHGYTINYRTEKKGKKEIQVLDTIVDNVTGEIVEPTCQFFNSPEDYENAGYIAIEPMSAKEPLNEQHQEDLFNYYESIAEEKFDGVRGTFHINAIENRIFSRRISVKTEWYGDNSDRLPQFRDYPVPHLEGTIIDGELIIPNVDFQDISGMLNMDWDKAIERQVEIGLCEFIAFDIIMYKGVYIAKMPLSKRKKWLEKVVKEMNHPLVKVGEYTQDTIERPVTQTLEDLYNYETDRFKETYPNLFEKYEYSTSPVLTLTKKEWYEYIVLHGGEGLMLKPSDGLYYHKRTREYTKIKKFGTWDVVITRFLPPTREYDGKEIDTWEYWEGDTPVTKHHYMGWIGTVAYGVVITHEELKAWQKKNPKEKPITYDFFDKLILEVGDCGGFTEEMRSYITEHQDDLIGTVIEVKGHEVLKTGKIRHPRFIRMREDKGAYQCIYADHMRN